MPNNFQIVSIEFYEHQSMVRKTCFVDPDRQIPHAQPVIADVNGVLPPIYFADENWPYTTDAITRNWRDEIIAKFCPMGVQCTFDRGFGWMR